MGLFNLSVIVLCCVMGFLLYEQPTFTKLMAFLPVAMVIAVFYFFRSIKQRDERIGNLKSRVDELERALEDKK